MWGIAYNVDQYPAAIKAAARHGMDEYRFVFWLKEYARRSKPGEALMLPVAVRWGENERPRRTQVEVPMYTMKDFDSLWDAAEAALRLEVDADAGAEVYMRDMRAPDVPEVWARIVVEGVEKAVQFNPLKMWRGEVKLCEGWCDLKQIYVQEWCVVEREAKAKATRPGKPSPPPVLPPVLPPVPQSSARSWISRYWWLVAAAVVAMLLGVVVAAVVLPDDKPQKRRRAVAGSVARERAGRAPSAAVSAPAARRAAAFAPAERPAPAPVDWEPVVGASYVFEWRSTEEAPRLFNEKSYLLDYCVKGVDSPQAQAYFRSLVRGRKAGYLPMEAKVLEVDGTFCRMSTPGGMSGWVRVEELRRTTPRPVNP